MPGVHTVTGKHKGQRVNPETSPTPVEAKIYRDNTYAGICRVMYLGLLGAVLDADFADLPVGLELEVELRLTMEENTPACRLRAVVNQHSRLGVGLTFRDPGKQENGKLREIVYESWRFAAEPRRGGTARRPTAIAWHASRTLPKAG